MTEPTLKTAAAVRRALKHNADPEEAAFFPRFFRTAPGEYGEGDRFLGVTVPKGRKIAKAARRLDQAELSKLLRSPLHEERQLALFILVDAFKRAHDEAQKKTLYRFYVRHLDRVNNWDLVDGSAPTIVGGYYADKDRAQLYRWAKSRNLWKRRIAMLATLHFIKNDEFDDALGIASILRNDHHDLIHKAVG